MPNKCGVVCCNGNYDNQNKCRVFRLPKDEREMQKWLNVLPPRENFVIDSSKFFICERHWPQNVDMITMPGGKTRPTCPPSIFAHVADSCLPTPKAPPRQPKSEDRQLDYFLKKDKITCFSDFSPEKQLYKKYENLVISRSEDKLVCVFMSKDLSESKMSIIVYNKPTLCSPLTLYAFKNGVSVPLGKILNPNNGIACYSQFFEAVNLTYNHNIQVDVIEKVTKSLQALDFDLFPADKAKKLKFVTRQLELLHHKQSFSISDYCFAIESFPNCHYDQLRDFLVLPSKRKLQSIVSATNIGNVLDTTFAKTNDQQKNVFLIIDEVKIRPTIAYSAGVLNGMAKNDPESKATSMLCIMMKCLHGGPSVMIYAIPVHKLTAAYQFIIVKEAAALVEKSGGIVLGSITDNHKINQQYCKLFDRITDYQARHPLHDQRVWFLLFDTVHILKCLRNNWITEKCQKLSLDNEIVGSFSDVINLYKTEKDNILKTTSLTHTSVYPSRLQLQNVQHVLRVFNEKVVAALKLQGAQETANFIESILNWWNIVNVSSKGQDIRLRDPSRSVQEENSQNLQSFLDRFKGMSSGHGPKRVQCLTHDTKRALLQTTEGLIAVCHHLYTVGFKYVLLRELQSDRIEGEFSVYRQSTGANAFMTAGDVFFAFKKRLARYAASFLDFVEKEPPIQVLHSCEFPIDSEDAAFIENNIFDVPLSGPEESAAAYVAGWLEKKCADDLVFDEDEAILDSEAKNFIEEVSRGFLTVPHMNTYELVRAGLCFMNRSKHKACCSHKMIEVLGIIEIFYDLRLPSKKMFRRLANVLLHGMHNLERDQEKNSSLYQTSIKKARLAN